MLKARFNVVFAFKWEDTSREFLTHSYNIVKTMLHNFDNLDQKNIKKIFIHFYFFTADHPTLDTFPNIKEKIIDAFAEFPEDKIDVSVTYFGATHSIGKAANLSLKEESSLPLSNTVVFFSDHFAWFAGIPKTASQIYMHFSKYRKAVIVGMQKSILFTTSHINWSLKHFEFVFVNRLFRPTTVHKKNVFYYAPIKAKEINFVTRNPSFTDTLIRGARPFTIAYIATKSLETRRLDIFLELLTTIMMLNLKAKDIFQSQIALSLFVNKYALKKILKTYNEFYISREDSGIDIKYLEERKTPIVFHQTLDEFYASVYALGKADVLVVTNLEEVYSSDNLTHALYNSIPHYFYKESKASSKYMFPSELSFDNSEKLFFSLMNYNSNYLTERLHFQKLYGDNHAAIQSYNYDFIGEICWHNVIHNFMEGYLYILNRKEEKQERNNA